MDMVKAALSHSTAFHHYVNACTEDGLDIYTGISDGSDAYLERRIAYSKGEGLPQARGRGIASHMLSWVQRHVLSESAIITCERGNLASQKVIEKCGGQFLNTFYSEQDKHEVLRYQLEPK
ncbi:GNAT family N-acetyltransferase [Vibrio splendidus]|uniref:GNAT family N-acetyltransferase n=1 Tax=Vibrio splendidus TaxID=29497 RepID=UPI000808E923|nr:acetyltransferase [Vibrio splendidus]SBS68586.1 hypothetical protein VHE8714_04425 [Vibrio splendidus]